MVETLIFGMNLAYFRESVKGENLACERVADNLKDEL
jgi:hypothetical protein